MINKISGYNFDITDFDLFKRAEKHVPKELATIINAIAGTFFLSLNSLYFKVLSLPFLLNAQTIHQKGNVSLSQKNAQVILKTALCVIVGLVANKTKALIVAPLGIYIISKKLHFPQRNSNSSRNDGSEDQSASGTSSPSKRSRQPSPDLLSSASSDQEDAHEGSPTRQYSSKQPVDRVPNVLAPAQRSESSAGTVPAIRLDALRGGAPCQEFQKDPKPTPLSDKPSAGSAPFRQRWKKGRGAGKKTQELSGNAALNASGAAAK
jgi:hypothetical protein